MQEGLTCTKDVLYAARRKEIEQLKGNEINNLLNEMKQWKNWSNIINVNKDNKLESFYVFHDPISRANYSSDICIIDDTSCTNYFGMPLLVILSEDENARSQVVSFSIMSSRTSSSFEEYFKVVKDKVGEIRLFICDRNKTQIKALKTVFPKCKIIFCAVHIGRNIKEKVGNEMFDLYQKLRCLEITEE